MASLIKEMLHSGRDRMRKALRHPATLRKVRGFAGVLPLTRPIRSGNLLLAPPGGGNIGDQAMVEAFIENVPDPVTIICRSNDDLRALRQLCDVRVVRLSGLVYGSAFSHLLAYFKFRRLVAGADSFSVVGADIMDGAYNRSASINRAAVLGYAADRRINTRILGFSWNATADSDVKLSLRSAAENGAALYVRDPVSFERVSSFCSEGAIASADTVFSARSFDDGVFDRLGIDNGREYVLVNLSALIGRQINQIPAYTKVVDRLIGSGIHVVLVPHVSRPGADDCEEIVSLRKVLPAQGVTQVASLLSPSEIRALAGGARFVVTGRMHLGVIALSQKTPAVILGSQGKVEGLLGLFGVPELFVDPGDDLDRSMMDALEHLLRNEKFVRRSIDSAHGEVMRLSSLNFGGF